MEIYKGWVVLPALERKPYSLWQSNVLISRDGHVCLGDFGSARVEEV